MSRYAQLARSWWQDNRPAELSTMDDPDSFFSTLGQQIEGRIGQLELTLAGPDSPGEDYLEKVGRLNAARSQAQEMALDELVWSIGPEGAESEEPSPAAQAIMEAHRIVREALA